MTTQPTDLRLPRRPLGPREPRQAESAASETARDTAFAIAFEQAPEADRRDSGATTRLAEALRGQLRDLEAQQQAISKLLDGLDL